MPHATIVRALEIAQRTASWCNVQPWTITITSGEATDRFRDALSGHVGQAGWPNLQPDGDFDFPGLFRALSQAGYTGVFTNAFGSLEDMLSARDLFAGMA